MKNKRFNKKNHKKQKNKHLKRNPAAIISAILIGISGMIFSLFNLTLFGEKISNSQWVMFNLITKIFGGNLPFNTGYNILVFFMVLIYITIFLFYSLNGLGIIKNTYSRYASILSIIYLFLGLTVVIMINNEKSITFLGMTLNSIKAGMGIYIVPIVGALYLFSKKWVNSIIKI